MVRSVEQDFLGRDATGGLHLRVHALVLCARLVGQQIAPGLRDLAVNVALVIDNTLLRDEMLDFAKAHPIATGFLGDGHASPRAQPGAPAEGRRGTAVGVDRSGAGTEP